MAWLLAGVIGVFIMSGAARRAGASLMRAEADAAGERSEEPVA